MDGRRRHPISWHVPSLAGYAVSGADAFAIKPADDGSGLEYSYDGSAWAALAGGGGTWDAIPDPVGNQVLDMNGYTSTWTWDTTTGGNPNFIIEDTTTDNGGALLYVRTAASSQKAPLRVDAKADPALVVDVNGKTGFGVASGFTHRLTISQTSTDDTGVLSGGLVMQNSTPIGAPSAVSLSFSDISTNTFAAAAALMQLQYSRNSASTNTGANFDIFRILTPIIAATTNDATAIRVTGPAVSSGKTLTLWEGIRLLTSTGAGTITNKRAIVVDNGAGDVVFNSATALNPTDTNGFVWLPQMAGTPSGSPATNNGAIATVIDATNKKFYGRIGSTWENLTGANPAGSASELQYRSSATALGAVTNSSVNGADIVIAGKVTAQFTTATAKQAIASAVTYSNSSTLGGTFANQFSIIDGATAASDSFKWGVRFLWTWNGTGSYTDYIALAKFDAAIAENLSTFRSAYITAPTVGSGKTLTTWEGIRIDAPTGAGTITNQRAIVVESGTGDVVFNSGTNLATSASSGFVFLPVMTDAPSGGTPASYTGARAVVIEEDTTNGQYNLYGYLNGAWRNLSSGTGGYATIQDEGTPLTQRATMNFTGGCVSATDDAGNSRTNIIISAVVSSATGSEIPYTTGTNTQAGISGSSVSGGNVTWAGYQAQTFNNANTSGTYSYYDQNITITAASNSTASHYLRDVGVTFSTAVNTASVRLTYADINHNQTGTISSFYGSHLTYTNSAGTTTTVGGDSFTYSATAGTTSQAVGFQSALNAAGGTLTAGTGFYSTFDNSSGTLTTATGFRMFVSGTIGTTYGFILPTSFNGIGTTSPTHSLDIVNTTDVTLVRVESTAARFEVRDASIRHQVSSDSNAPAVTFFRTRGSLGSNSNVSNGDGLGSFTWQGRHTTGTDAAIMGAFVEGTPSAGIVPARLEFHTYDAAGAAHVPLILDSNGDAHIRLITSTPSDTPKDHTASSVAPFRLYTSGGTSRLYSYLGGAWVNLSGTTNASDLATGTVALARGGTGASLSDPNADRILFWDDSAGAVTWLTLGTNLSITGTTLDAAGGSGGYATVQDEGGGLTARTTLNFTGAAVSAADDAGNTRTNVTISAYTTVQDEGTPVTARTAINFIGGCVSAADDAGNSRTNITISAVVSSATGSQIPYTTGTNTQSGISGTSVSGADVTWGGNQIQTYNSSATSGTISYYDQNITINPASNSTADHRLQDIGVTFSTAVNTATVKLRYANITHGQTGTVNSFYVDDVEYYNTAGTTTTVGGTKFTYSAQAGTTSQAIGHQVALNAAAGTLSNAIGFYSTFDRSAGTLSTVTGFRMFTSGTIGTTYGIILPTSFNGIGTATPTHSLDIVNTTDVTIMRVESTDARFEVRDTSIRHQVSSNSTASSITFFRTRGTLGSNSNVSDGDSLGAFTWQGRHTTAANACAMEAFVEGTPSAAIVPGRLEFYTYDSSGGLHTSLVLDSNGDHHVPYRTSSFSDTPKDHTGSSLAPIRVSNISSVYKIHVYLGGAWRSVTLT